VTGSTTPALYAIGTLSLICAGIILYGLPARLRVREARPGRVLPEKPEPATN